MAKEHSQEQGSLIGTLAQSVDRKGNRYGYPENRAAIVTI